MREEMGACVGRDVPSLLYTSGTPTRLCTPLISFRVFLTSNSADVYANPARERKEFYSLCGLTRGTGGRLGGASKEGRVELERDD